MKLTTAILLAAGGYYIYSDRKKKAPLSPGEGTVISTGNYISTGSCCSGCASGQKCGG